MYSNHRDFFRILLCFVLAFFFAAILAVAELTDAYKGGKESKEFDEIYPLWTISAKGYIVEENSRDLLKVPVSISVISTKSALYKLRDTSFRIKKEIRDEEIKAGKVLITPDDVDIDSEYKSHVKVVKVEVKTRRSDIEPCEEKQGVFFKIKLDRVIRKELPVNVNFDADNDYKWIDWEEMKNKMFPERIWFSGSKTGLDNCNQIETEQMDVKQAPQLFTLQEVQLKIDNPRIYKAESSVEVLLLSVKDEEEFTLPVSMIFPIQNGEGYTLETDLKDVKVTLRGKRDLLEELKSDPHKYVYPYISLSKRNISPGSQTESLKVECFINKPGIEVTKIEPENLIVTYKREVKSMEVPPPENGKEDKKQLDDSPVQSKLFPIGG